MFRFQVSCLALVCCMAIATMANPSPYRRPVEIVAPGGLGEAQAAASSNLASAKAAAAQLSASSYPALHRYGHEIGVPLLVKPFGQLTGLYAAALPPRSFVGNIDPVFVKGPYGKIKYIGESSIGVAAI